MDQEPNVYLCINAFVHLCICVFVYNVDDTDDDILMIVEMALIFSPLWNFIPQNIQNSIATKMMPKMQTMMCWWWYCGLSIKKHNILPPWLPTSCYLFLTMALHQKISIPICPDFANICRILDFFIFWGSGSLEERKSKKSEKRRKLSGVIFQTRSSQTWILFHILIIYIFIYIFILNIDVNFYFFLLDTTWQTSFQK